MKKPTILLLLLLLLAPTLVLGCALTGKADALSVRYFNPETMKPRLTSASPPSGGADSSTSTASAPPRATVLDLELGRISSGAHLRDKIAYRDAAFEVGYYDDKRWTERPEVFVRRELSRTLFEEHGFRRSLGGHTAPVLELEVIAFEEVKSKPAPLVRIQVRMIIHDGLESLVEKTITVERPLPAADTSIDAVVRALAEALDVVAEEVAKDAERVLTRVAAARRQ